MIINKRINSMKTINIFYSIFFFINAYTINLHSSQLFNAKFIAKIESSSWPQAEQLDSLLRKGSKEEIKNFFKIYPTLINRNISPRCPLVPLAHCLSYRETSEQDLCNTVQTLIDCGANVNNAPKWVSYGDRYLPIIIAAKNHLSARLLQILFTHGASCNARDDRRTVLQHILCRITVTLDKKLLPLLDKALQYGANPFLNNTDGKNCFDIVHEIKKSFTSQEGAFHNNHELENNDFNNLKLLNKITLLLETNYLKLEEITETATRVHLKYNLKSSDAPSVF